MADTSDYTPENQLSVPDSESSPKLHHPINITVLLVIISLFILSAGLIITARFHSSPSISSTKNPDAIPTRVAFNKDNYKIDSDGDKLPDFIETEMGLDPKKNEVEACYNNKCNDPNFQQAYVKKHNVVIILDSSGSMILKTGAESKMDAAKSAITAFVTAADNQTAIGLIEYGHLGSNSDSDKAVSCASADILAPVGSLTKSNVSTILAPVKPTGWTPIGLALRKAKDLFTGKEKDNNEVYIVTDGAETCDTDPVGAATVLAASDAHIKVNVIGFAVTDNERTGLEAINVAGKGSFASVNSSSELEDVFKRNQQNWTSLTNANDCIASVINRLDSCIVDLHNKIDKFRAGYINQSAAFSQEEINANESVYYSYFTYLQNFESQKSADLIKMKNSFVDKL